MINKLLAYQKVDATLREIEVAISKSEERKKAAVAKNFLNSVNESIASLDQRAEELVSKYNSAIKLYEKLIEETKEYDEMGDMDEEQLAYVKKKAQSLSDEISALSQSIDTLSKEMENVLKELSQLKADTKKYKAQYSEFRPKYEELKASKESEMNAIKAELKKLEKGIPPEVLDRYNQKRKEKIFPVLNEAKEISKHAYCRCGTELPVTSYNGLKSGNLVECDSCHRLLYFKQ